MLTIEEELALAEQEMRSGSLDKAVEILQTLKSRLESQAFPLQDEHARNMNLVKVLNDLGVVQKNQGDLVSATESLESALDIAHGLKNDSVRMRSSILSNLGLLYSRRRMYARGKAAFDEALSLAESNPGEVHPGFKVKIRNNRALFFVRFGELDRARDELSQSLEAAREHGSGENESEREAWLNANLGMIHAELGEEEVYDPSRREELFRQARTMFLRSADLYGGQGYIHNKLKQVINVVEIEIRLGALEEARRGLREARREAERISSGRLLCEIAQVNVEIALKSGEREQLIDRVVELLDNFKSFEPPDLPARKARLESMLRRAGRKDVLKLIADLGNSQKGDQNVPKAIKS
jgi:tetratricopeptide (TPR) repeat protein